MAQEGNGEHRERGSGHAELLEEFARFLKCSFTYPANNRRVLAHLKVFLELAKELRADAEPVAIAVNGEDFYVDRHLVVEKTVHTTWMREAFLRTALGGVRVGGQAPAESLHSFARVLRENFARPGGSFSEQWVAPIEGIEPIELRFTGRFAGIEGVEDATVKGADWLASGEGFAGFLMQNERLQEKLVELQRRLAGRLPGGDDTVQVNILDPISKALPAEAKMDMNIACDLVEQILDECGDRIVAVIEEGGISDRDMFESVVADVGRRFFKSHVKNPDDWDPSKLPEGRPEDERIHDDLESMLAEYERLPRADGIELRMAMGANPREMFGVYVYEMLRPVSEPVAARAAAHLRALLDAQPVLVGLLDPYVEACLPRPPEPEAAPQNREQRFTVRERLLGIGRTSTATRTAAAPKAARPAASSVQPGGPEWRIVEFMIQGGWTQLLAGRDWSAPEVMGLAFPRLFGLCLDRLDRGTSSEDRQIAEICRRVGPVRILAHADHLIEHQGILRERRLRRLLAVQDPAMLPILRLIVERGPTAVRKDVAGQLRKRELPVGELVALQGVPPGDLSERYLLALCEPEIDADGHRWLRDESGRLLRRFLTESAGQEEMSERRIFAIDLLRTLPCQESLNVLQSIRNEAGRFLLSRAKQALRKAAAEAYEQMAREL